MNIAEKSVVSMHYKLTDKNGGLLDESSDQPLMYMHGTGSLIPGLEKALEGKTVGDRIQVTVLPEDAYGPVAPQLIQKIPSSTFRGVDKVEVGMEFEATGENGHIMVVRVEEVEGDEVTINGNHPLAGFTLNFDVNIIEVREATKEELDHGHAHDGHNH
jgi:FKBP-type peptidyl-prolyl cis-trans isomerase SlyD